MRYFKYLLVIIKILLCKVLSYFILLNKNKKNIILIGERQAEAKDNGYHLFKYIRENHPTDNVFYVIKKESTDLKKIKNLGNIIYYDTLKHYLYYIMAEKLVCAHQPSCVPNSPVFWKFEQKNILRKKKIYIKHGIIKEKISSHMYSNTKFEKIICGAKPEYDFVKSKLGYPQGTVKYLGLCRFDNLHNFKTKRQIFMMLTWRQWFGLETTILNKEEDRQKFIKSKYFKAINDIFESSEFNRFLENNDYELIFHPHHEMQRYIDLFKTNSSRIVIANEKEYDVQQLLKESEILITDYSSIAFDFAYMKKPIIYYQFDKEEYDKKHYQKGYFDYGRDGFGEVCENLSELLECIQNIEEKEEIFLNRVKEFFTIYDNRNCERHYKEIVK